MADNGAITFPDEVDAVKAAAKAKQEVESGDTNTVEEAPAEVPQIALRNMITVPSNCPAGEEMGADGVCRVVFK